MTDFTQECIAKDVFVVVEHEKMRLPQKFVKGDGNLNVNVKKNSICRFCGVNFTSGGGRASFENLFSPSGRVESARLILAHLLWLYWVAIKQKRKLVRMGLQTLWSQN